MKKLMAILVIVGLLSVLFIINCSNRNPASSTTAAGLVEQISLTIPPAFKAPSGLQTVQITAAALDANGAGLPNVPVQFSVSPQMGQIAYSDTLHQTNAAGNITVNYTVYVDTSILLITITAKVLNSEIQDSKLLTITPLTQAIASLTLDPKSSVLWIGQNTTITDTLTATIKDAAGNGISGVLVSFNAAPVGLIQNISDTTNNGGVFKSLLTVRQEDIPSGQNAITTTVSASVGIHTSSDNITVIRQTTVPDNIDISANPASMKLAGTQEGQSELTITVTDEDGVGVPGFVVDLSTTGGSVTAPSLTNASGQTKTTLKSTALINPVVVTATVYYVPPNSQDTLSISDDVSVTFQQLESTISSIEIWSEPVSINLAANDSSIIKARVKDANNQVIPDLQVLFWTDMGALVAPQLTDASGIASVTYYPPNQPGTATVWAKAGIDSLSTTVSIVAAAQPNTIIISAEPLSMKLTAGQSGSSQITVTIIDTNGVGVPGMAVNFTTNRGTITTAPITNYLGQTSATLTSMAISDSAKVTATVQDYPSLSAIIYVKFIALESTIQSITIWAEPQSLILSSGENAVVKARVIDTNNQAIQGLSVNFWASQGAISTPTLTDTAGIAKVIFYPNGQFGAASVWAKVGGDSVSTTVSVLSNAAPSNISMIADPSSMKLTTGQTGNSAITVTLTDSNGVGVPGLIVNFTTNRGSITSGIATDEFGQALAALSSQSITDSAKVTATVQDYPALKDSVYVKFIALQSTVQSITVWAEPQSLTLSSGNNSIVKARVIDTNNTAIQGLAVDFWASQGAISTPTLTDTAGIAQVNFYHNNQLGSALVWAKVGGDSASTTISVLPDAEPANIAISADPLSMKLTTGQTGSSEITVTLTDSNGVGVPGLTVNFTTNRGSITSGIATDDYGQAAATLSSQSISDSARVIASVLNYPALKDTIYVKFIALQSTVQSITIWAEPQSLTLSSGNNSIVKARVIDTNNTAIQGLAVDFWTTKGAISAPTLTDTSGVAQVTFYPNNQLGTATIWARVGEDSNSTNINIFSTEQPNSIVLSADPQQLTAAAGANATSQITITVKDDDGVGIPGLTVNLNTTKGYLTAAQATNASGQTTTTLTYAIAAVKDTARVTASVTYMDTLGVNQTVTNYIDIIFTPLESSVFSMSIWAEPSTISLASSASSIVRARVIDSDLNAIVGLQVKFTATKGALTPSSLTDSTGIATTNFYANGDTGLAVVKAIVPGIDTVSTTITVTIFSISGQIYIYSSDNAIYADGPYTSAVITARLVDSNFMGIPGDTINFHNMPIYTSITANVVTDSMGEAHATFNDQGIPTVTPTYPDSAAYIWATHSGLGLTSDTLHILILEPPEIDSISLVALGMPPTGLIGNGMDTTILQATVYKSDGSRAPYGTTVLFDAVFHSGVYTGSQAGTLIPTPSDTFTNANGVAQVKFISALSVDTVLASAVVPSYPLSLDEILLPHRAGNPSQLELVNNPGPLYVQGPPCDIIVSVQDTVGNPVKQILVNFTASLGIITQSAQTDFLGEAHALLSPQTSAGVSLVTAKVNGLLDSLSFGVSIIAGSPSSIELSSNVDQIQVQGTGGQESATLTALVRDPNGNLVGDGVLVIFVLMPPSPSDASFDNGLNQDSSTTIEGSAMVSLISGLTSGPVKIKAKTLFSIDTTATPDDTTWIQAIKSNLVIASGSPENIYIDYSDEVETTASGAGLKLEVNARVVDVHGNNVAPGTAVWFSISPQYYSPYYNSTVATIDGSATIIDSTGICYTFLYYNSEATFDSVDVVANCTTGDTTLATATSMVILPLYDGELYLTVTPEAHYFMAGQTIAVMECYAMLVDGLGHAINNGKISFNNTLGSHFFYSNQYANSANGQTNTGPAYRRYNMYTGPNARELLEPSYGYNMQWPDHQPFPSGVAILYLRAIESEYTGAIPYPGVFLDGQTPQVVGDVHAKVTMYQDVAADAANIIFLRTP